MSGRNLAETTSRIHEIVKDLSEKDLAKVLNAVLALSASEARVSFQPATSVEPVERNRSTLKGAVGDHSACEFFENKAPQSKVQELAVAARFRELSSSEVKHSKKDFEKIFSSARRNFDAENFPSDMRNAKKDGFFMKGTKNARSHQLSYAGQNFVDSLPDQQAAKKAMNKKRVKRQTKKKGKA